MLSPKSPDTEKPASPLRIVIPALVLVSLFALIVLLGALPLVEDRRDALLYLMPILCLLRAYSLFCVNPSLAVSLVLVSFSVLF